LNLHYSIDILILSLNDFKKKQVYNVCLFLSRIFKAVVLHEKIKNLPKPKQDIRYVNRYYKKKVFAAQ